MLPSAADNRGINNINKGFRAVLVFFGRFMKRGYCCISVLVSWPRSAPKVGIFYFPFYELGVHPSKETLPSINLFNESITQFFKFSPKY